jgi:PBP1b-binding outer membrane lipoprotein LpoB
MKQAKILSAFVLILFFLSGCGIHMPLTANLNQHNTNVNLQQKNFKVVAYVKGEAKATFILGFGGLKKKTLIENAKADMLKNVDMVGSSRAIVNETVEIHTKNYLVYVQTRVVVSAHVVEFQN